MDSPVARLTQGPVGRHLVDMTLPMLLGITTMMAQAFIDTWFLGKVGDRALAGYSFGFPILMIVSTVEVSWGTMAGVAAAKPMASRQFMADQCTQYSVAWM